jgi:Txe/YoeB family toxin of Txe-Axe toxin-antitoxin module
MKVSIDESFTKDTDRISNKKIRSRVADIIEEVKRADKLSAIRNCKKLKGYKKSIESKLVNIESGLFLRIKLLIFQDFSIAAKFTSISRISS